MCNQTEGSCMLTSKKNTENLKTCCKKIFSCLYFWVGLVAGIILTLLLVPIMKNLIESGFVQYIITSAVLLLFATVILLINRMLKRKLLLEEEKNKFNNSYKIYCTNI